MKNRVYIGNLKNHIGTEVTIAGSVDIRRDHGKLIFIDLRDASGKVQMVALPNHKEAHALASTVRPEWVINVKGNVNKRPDKMVNKDEDNGTIELEILDITILAAAKELPFELGTEINIDTYLDNLPLTLRDEKHRAIFKVQAEIVKTFRGFFTSEGFVEFQAPKLKAGTASTTPVKQSKPKASARSDKTGKPEEPAKPKKARKRSTARRAT